LNEISRFVFKKPDSKETDVFGFVRCHIDVSSSGKIKLLLNSASVVSLWLDALPIEVKSESLIELKPGLHTLTFALNLQQQRENLRCELADAGETPAHFQIVSGK